MKNNFTNLTKLLGISFFVFSCNSDQELPISMEKTNEGENISEIALLEEELQINLYKRDFILTDATGDNQVTLRVAAKEEDVLESYLSTVNFTMTPVFVNDYPIDQTLKKKLDVPIEQNKNENFSGIITEFVNEQLKNDVIGVRLNVEVKENSENARMTYSYSTTHTSNNWPTLAKIETFGTAIEINYNFEAKNKALTSWYTGYLEVCKYNGNGGPDLSQCSHGWNQTPNQENIFWVDGPYRTRAVVRYWNAGSYGVTFIR